MEDTGVVCISVQMKIVTFADSQLEKRVSPTEVKLNLVGKRKSLKDTKSVLLLRSSVPASANTLETTIRV